MINLKEKIDKYILCPYCKQDLILSSKTLICKSCKRKFSIKDNILIMLDDGISEDLELSIKKWDILYQKQLEGNILTEMFEKYDNIYADDIVRQILDAMERDKASTYLEIGCGQFFNSPYLFKKFDTIIGIDICYSALVCAKKIFEKNGIENYILIQGNLLNLPIKNNSVNLIYGGGVIEHFKETQRAVDELYRILANGGICLNSVPYLNIGSLTYRQLWGNIPNFIFLKQIAEFIHIKLLKGRHMIFGYEFSFTAKRMKKIHMRAGFDKKNIIIKRFEVRLLFEFLPNCLKKYAQFLSKKCRLFWPMIKIIAKK